MAASLLLRTCPVKEAVWRSAVSSSMFGKFGRIVKLKCVLLNVRSHCLSLPLERRSCRISEVNLRSRSGNIGCALEDRKQRGKAASRGTGRLFCLAEQTLSLNDSHVVSAGLAHGRQCRRLCATPCLGETLDEGQQNYGYRAFRAPYPVVSGPGQVCVEQVIGVSSEDWFMISTVSTHHG